MLSPSYTDAAQKLCLVVAAVISFLVDSALIFAVVLQTSLVGQL
jgi:hypothetical protein